MSFLPRTDIVTAEDYEDHFLFQSSFSYRPLNSHGAAAGASAGMSVYRFAADGLPDLLAGDDVLMYNDFVQAPKERAPPFPLGDFLRGLNKPGRNKISGRITETFTMRGVFLAFAPLLFFFPCLIMRPRSGILKNNSHESVFVSPRRTFLRRPHRSS